MELTGGFTVTGPSFASTTPGAATGSFPVVVYNNSQRTGTVTVSNDTPITPDTTLYSIGQSFALPAPGQSTVVNILFEVIGYTIRRSTQYFNIGFTLSAQPDGVSVGQSLVIALHDASTDLESIFADVPVGYGLTRSAQVTDLVWACLVDGDRDFGGDIHNTGNVPILIKIATNIPDNRNNAVKVLPGTVLDISDKQVEPDQKAWVTSAIETEGNVPYTPGMFNMGSVSVVRQSIATPTQEQYQTIAEAEAQNIPNYITDIIVLSYSSATKPYPANYKAVNAQPAHAGWFQDAGGRYWENQSPILYAEMFGAIGDGATNNDVALKNFSDTVLATHRPGRIGPGGFIITGEWSIGYNTNTGPDPYGGQEISGVGPGFYGGSVGTEIVCTGTGHRSVIAIQSSVSRYFKLSNLSVRSATVDGCTYGVCWPNTIFSQHRIDWVYVKDTQNGFAILQTTGGNGEFILFNYAGADNIKTDFFVMSASGAAGQSFGHKFFSAVCSFRALNNQSGGPITGTRQSFFNLGYNGQGYSLMADGFDGTFGPIDTTALVNYYNDIPPCVVLRNNGIGNVASFANGRIEHATALMEVVSPTTINASPTIVFDSLILDGMYCSEVNPIFDLAISNDNTEYIVRGCTFNGSVVAAASYPISRAVAVAGPYATARLRLESCFFTGFKNGFEKVWNYNSYLTMKDCRVNLLNSDQSVKGQPLYSINSEIVPPNDMQKVRGRSFLSDNPNQSQGVPDNELIKPYLNGVLGAGVVPPAPWSIYGASGTVEVARYPDSQVGNFTRSESAFLLKLPANTGISQTLSGGFPAYYNNIVYQCMGLFYGGDNNTVLEFRIVNSSSGIVYDSFGLNPQATYTGPVCITLTGSDNQGAAGNYKLEIYNNSPAECGLLLFWQLMSRKDSPVWVDAPTVKVNNSYWQGFSGPEVSIHKGGVFTAPIRSDAARPASAPGMVYVSSTTGKLCYCKEDGVTWVEL